MSDNIEYDFTVYPGIPQQVLTTPTEESSSSSDHIAIQVEDMETATHDIDVTPQPHEQEQEAAPAPVTGEKGECRFCHEDDLVSQLESPCACNGTLKYAHRRCIHRWCNAKGDSICEICRQPYVPNYSVTEPRSNGDTAINIRERWTIPGTNTQIQLPLLMAERASDRVTAALNQDCNLRRPTRGVLCGIILVLLLTGLILRDVFYYRATTKEEEDKASHTAFCILMIMLGPFCFLSCLYECRVIRRRRRQRSGKGSHSVVVEAYWGERRPACTIHDA